MKINSILFDIIQIFISIVILSFYLIDHSDSTDCNITTNIIYSLKAYILFSLISFIIISIIKLISLYYLKNKIIVNAIILTLSYGVILIIAIGGIFIAQQMNTHNNCYRFFTDNKNIFCIYISILLLTLINIIRKCIECKNEQTNENYDDEYKFLINQL
jgi:hypothetical protein